MSNFPKTFQKLERLNRNLEQYALKNNQVNESYYIAKNLIAEMSQKSYKNENYCKDVYIWLMEGSTLKLKKLLSHLNYEEENLNHFNSFALIDTIN
jgi:hypothetical protein